MWSLSQLDSIHDKRIAVAACQALWGSPATFTTFSFLPEYTIKVLWNDLMEIDVKYRVEGDLITIISNQLVTEIDTSRLVNVASVEQSRKSKTSLFWIDKKRVNKKLEQSLPLQVKEAQKLFESGERIYQHKMQGDRTVIIMSGITSQTVYNGLVAALKLPDLGIEVLPEWYEMQYALAASTPVDQTVHFIS